MKRVLIAIFVTATACATVAWAEAPSKEMLEEMKSCSVCGVMAEKPELMADMTWETHKIDNGMLCVASVPKDKMKELAKLHDKMMKQVELVKADAEQGKTSKLCSFCSQMAEIDKAGAKQQHIKTATAFISLITSSDPAVVAKIHACADKAIAEQKKMAEANQVSLAN